MADKYYRLVGFLVNICPQPLRELFLKYMNADPNRALDCTTLGGYLASRKPQLQVMRKRKVIRQDQWQLLFPPGGNVDESSWDTTLLILLIDELFKMQIQTIEKNAIQDIRDIRNQLQHMAETSLADTDFDGMWNLLETATLDLAKQIQPSPTYAVTIREYINDTKINNMPKLGDTLRYWYEHIIMKLKSDMEDMKEIMMEISENTADNVKYVGGCHTILSQSSVKKVGPSGEKVKRMKTVDQILAKLNHYFITTLNEDFSISFDNPPEVADIKTKLRDVHHVVVTGHRGSRYLEAALAAIQSMSYNTNRCVEIRDPSDWRHIDPEEVDLVLCKEPFGDYSYDEKRTKGMADIFSNMLRTAKAADGSKPLDIVIVSDQDVLQQVLKIVDHDLLAEVVKVYQATTEKEPADLTNAYTEFEDEVDTCTRNLSEFTAALVDRYRNEAFHSTTIVNEAKANLKRKKMLVLTGPRKCGKTSLAVILASRYQKKQFLILNKPDDLKFIRLGTISTVLIEDFAGKYDYDVVSIRAWLKEFEMLYSAVLAEKLNVLMTCEEAIYERCIKEFGLHPIIQNIFKLECSEKAVKQENNGESRVSDMEVDTIYEKSDSVHLEATIDANSLESEMARRVVHSSDAFHNIKDMCSIHDNSLLCLNQSSRILHVNGDLSVEGTYEIKEQDAERICHMHAEKFLIISYKHLSVYEFKNDNIHYLMGKDLEHDCDSLAADKDGNISIFFDRSIYEYDYDLDLTAVKRLPMESTKDTFITGITLLCDRKCVVIVKQDSIHSVRYKSKNAVKSVLYLEDKKLQPFAVCAGLEDVFILCLHEERHTRILRMGLDLEKMGSVDVTGCFYTPYSITSMILLPNMSGLLLTYCGRLDELQCDQLIGTKTAIRNVDTAKFTRVKKIDEIAIDFSHPVHHIGYNGFCQHPDGSFIVIGTDFDENTDTRSMMMYHVQSDFQYISHYDISNICTPKDFFVMYINIGCTDSGDVVIGYDDMVSIYKITDGTIHIIKSTEISGDVRNISFHRKRIYCLCYDNELYVLDTNLNVKKTVKFSFSSTGIGHVVPCLMQKYFYINYKDTNIICNDPKQKQIRYLRKEGFEPWCICAASDDSVFVVGRQDSKTRRILLLNTEMEILSDISVDTSNSRWFPGEGSKMEFDKVNARLIVETDRGSFIQIYLE